jgi:hypothetical protein
MSTREVVENEVFELLRQKDVLLQAGCTEEAKLVDLSIARFQAAHGPIQAKKHEGVTRMEAKDFETLKSEDTQVEGLCAELRGTTEKAFTLLLERRDRAYSEAIAGLETEREKLTQEAVSLREAERNLGELIPAKARVARSEADALLVSGKTAEAHAKIREAEEAANAPTAMKKRGLEIDLRLTAIEEERKTIARKIFETWYSECVTVHRSIERAHFILFLDGLKQSFFDFESSTGTSAQAVGDAGLFTVGYLTGLTAPERSEEWAAGHRWYSGRVR